MMLTGIVLLVFTEVVQANIYKQADIKKSEVLRYFNTTEITTALHRVRTADECAAFCTLSDKCPMFMYYKHTSWTNKRCFTLLEQDPIVTDYSTREKQNRFDNFDLLLEESTKLCYPTNDTRIKDIVVDAAFYLDYPKTYYIFSSNLVYEMKDADSDDPGNPDMCVSAIRLIKEVFGDWQGHVRSAMVHSSNNTEKTIIHLFGSGDPTTPTNLPHQAEDLFTGECNIVDIDCSWTNTPATNCTCLVTIDETGHTESYGMEVKIDRIVLHHLPGQGPSDYSDTLTAVVTLSDSRGLQFYYGSEGQACITSEGSCRPEKKLYGNYLIS